MASKILFLSILLLSFSGMSAKPVADKDQMPHDNVLSKFSLLNEETGSNKHTSSFKNNDDDYEGNEMNEDDEMNKKSKDIDEVMGKTAKRDGQGSTSRTKTSKKNHKEKYNDVHTPSNARKNHKEKYDVQIPDAILGYKRNGIELGLSDDATPQDQFQEEALMKHNKYRKLHDAQTLQLNKAMSESATGYAKSLLLQGSMDHSSQAERPDQGENLFMECSKTNLPSPNDAITKWYSEVCGYNFQDSKSNPGKVTGHFTQLVWKPTREIGIGYATGVDKHDPAMKCVCVVARYKPAGNILGWFSTSVVRREVNNICNYKKGNVLASEPDEGPLHTTQSDLVNSISERLFSEVFPHQTDTKLYEANDGMSVPGDVADGTEAPQEKQSSLPLYESNGENMGVPTYAANKVATDGTRVPSEQETSMTQPATNTNLYDSNGENIGVPAAYAANDVPSEQETSRTQPATNTNLYASNGENMGVPAYAANEMATDGTGVPSEQESNITPPATNTMLHESNGENMGVPSDDSGAPLKQESGADPTRMVSETSTADMSPAPSDTSSSTVPSEQESSSTPPGMNSETNSPDTTSVDDATPVKAPSATGTPITSTAPSQPPSNVVAPVASGKAPTTGPVTAHEESLKDFQQAILREHNSLRFRHLSKLLRLDANLNADARIRASELAKKPPSKGAFSLLPGGIGQNTYSQCGESLSGANVTHTWYDEICRSGFLNLQLLAQKAAQFNQVVWKVTQTIGVSFALGMDASGKQLCTHVVVLYKPGANLDWRSVQLNVKPGSFDARVHCRQLLNQGGSTVLQPGNPAPSQTQGNVKGSSPKLGATPQTLPSSSSTGPLTKVVPPALAGTPPKTSTSPNAGTPPGKAASPVLTATKVPSKIPTGTNLAVPSKAPLGIPQTTGTSSPPPNVASPVLTATPSKIPAGTNLAVPSKAPLGIPQTTGTSPPPPNVASPVLTATPSKIPAGTNLAVPSKAPSGSPQTPGTPQTAGSPTGNAATVPSTITGTPSSNKKTVAVPTASQTVDDFEKIALKQHNIFRKRHGAKALKLDRHLCKEAKKYAKKLSERGPDREPIHSLPLSRNGQGESLFVGCNADIDSADITRIWYNEVCHYDFTTYQSTGSAPIGHFAQIVWKSSTKFGIAREFKGDSQTGCVYVVARYSPKKMAGQEEDNIDKGKFTPAVCRVENENGKGATLTQRPEQFLDDALGAHNEFRLVHGVLPMSNDKNLNARAQKHADNLARQSTNDVAISNNLGESIYTSCNSVVTGRSVTEAWYWNVCNYDFAKKKSKDGIADHFTQLVWKGSTKVGFGVATAIQKQKPCVFVVARYFLPGNVAGQNKFNVFKGSFNEKQCAEHVFTPPQPTVGDTVVPSTSDSSVNNDDDNDGGDMFTEGENPDGSLTSQLDKQPPTAGILSAGVPVVAVTVSPKAPSKELLTSFKPPKVTTNKPPTVNTGTPQSAPSTLPMTTTTSTSGAKPFKNGPPKQLLRPSTAKTQPTVPSTAGSASSTLPTATTTSTSGVKPFKTGPSKQTVGSGTAKTQSTIPSATGSAPSTLPTTTTTSTSGAKPFKTGPSKQLLSPSTVKTQPTIPSATGSAPSTLPTATTTSTSGAKPFKTGPSKQLLGPSTAKIKPTIPSATGSAPSTLPTTTTTSTSGVKPFKTGPSKQTVGSGTAKTQPTTTSATGGLPADGTTTGSAPSTLPASTTIGTKPPSKIIPGSVATQQPALTTTAGTTPNSGTTLTTPSKVTPGATKPALTTTQPVTTTSASPNSGTSVASSSTGTNPTGPSKVALGTNTQPGTIASPNSGKPINTGLSKQVLLPVTSTTSSTSPPTTSGVPSSSPPVSTTAPPSTLPVVPAQNGINLNKHLYPGLGYKVGKSFLNDLGSESIWPATSSTVEMDNDMMYKDISKYEHDNMDDDMDSRFKNEALEDNVEPQMDEFNNGFNKDEFLIDKTQSSRFNHDKDKDMDSSFKEQPLQHNRNAQNSQFNMEGSSEDTLKGHLNQFNHDKDNDMDSSFKEQLLQDNRKAQNSQFNIAGSSDDALKGHLNQFHHIKNNDMDSSFKEQLLQDNRKAQNSQFSIAGSSDDALKGQLNQFNHVKNNDMDSSFKEQPVQDNINAQNNQFNMAGSSEDNLKAQNSQFNKEEPLEDNLNGQMNQFNHIKDDMDNTNQALQDTTKAQSHQFNHSKVNDMDKPIDDHTTAQTSQLNHHPPTNDTSSSNTEESKAPSIINHQMLHPWATQHSRHHYRDQDFTENQKYLTGKVMKTHQQQNWDKWGHYDDDMDLMRSDMTSWNDQGLEAGSKDISGSYNDPYGDMMGDYKEPYGSNGTSRGYGESYEDNKDGNYMDNEGVDKGMDGTYGETNNYDTDMTSMYKGTDSKAYPKQPEDNIGSMDTTLVVHSQDSRGKQRINGLSFEGGVGMSLQQYADEIGQVRGLHHMPSEKKEDNLKIKRKKKSKH